METDSFDPTGTVGVCGTDDVKCRWLVKKCFRKGLRDLISLGRKYMNMLWYMEEEAVNR